jgi:hypothetical protein
MIHDAIAFLYGNEQEHEKIAKILGGFSNLLADIYVKKTGKTKDEIRSLMRAESYFFGSEMMDAGFVDEIEEVGEKGDKDETVLQALARVEMTASRVKERPVNYQKIAALMNADVVHPPERPAFQNIQLEGNSMDMKKLKAEFPDVYQAALDEGKKIGLEASKEAHVAEGKASGILAERERIRQIEALAMPKEFTAKAKSEDWSPEKSAAEYLRAEAAKRSEIKGNIEADINEPLESNAPAPAVEPKAEKVDPVVAYNSEVKKLTDSGIKRTDAIKAVAKNSPELHQNYINALNGRA